MAWHIKRRLFGQNFEFDVSAKFPTLHSSYTKKLHNLWYGSFLLRKITAYEVIVESLKLLPKDFYIIYEFSLNNDFFVQFLHTGEGIIIDFPMYPGSPRYKKKADLIKILNKYKLFYYDSTSDKKRPEIRANFKYDYDSAARLCLEIARKIYKIVDDTEFRIYDSQELRLIV